MLGSMDDVRLLEIPDLGACNQLDSQSLNHNPDVLADAKSGNFFSHNLNVPHAIIVRRRRSGYSPNI